MPVDIRTGCSSDVEEVRELYSLGTLRERDEKLIKFQHDEQQCNSLAATQKLFGV